MHIPYGSTVSYKFLAQKIGSPKAVRAVGIAIGRNPLCLIVPCHRVLASDDSMGGYVAGIACKRHYLSLKMQIPITQILANNARII
ncbi:methylated-DNA--protein-cysteine methyltransferase [candidate division TM7 genomosp. GTL1]|nr:methylated-DNA--protein-cysteine methyltransferase [candidate division TM7 genomosp. GTL1]